MDLGLEKEKEIKWPIKNFLTPDDRIWLMTANIFLIRKRVCLIYKWFVNFHPKWFKGPFGLIVKSDAIFDILCDIDIMLMLRKF